MPASIGGICNTMFFGLLTNSNWMVTSVSMYIVFIITLTYYSIQFNYVDYVTILVLSITIVMITLILYKMEQRDKMEFLSFK
jgi:hypothetical protein